MKNETLKQPATIKELSKTDDALCIYLSLFGVLIALICFIQLLIYSDFSTVPLILMGLYVFNIISFVLLSLQKKFAPEFIFISVIVSLLIWYVYLCGHVFSLIVIVLLIYNLVVAATVLVQDLHKKIKHKANLIKAENEYWEGRL